MKKVTVLILLAILVVTACMVTLLNRGISLRIATLIKPSEVHSMQQVSEALFIRLFPEIQSNSIFVTSFENDSGDLQNIYFHLKKKVDEVKQKASVEITSVRDLWNCNPTCFLRTSVESGLEIQKEDYALNKITETKPHINIALIEFNGFDSTKVESCEGMQRLNFECIKVLSIKEAQRKMKDPSKRYFFLKKYNQNDYFLFLKRF